MDNIEKFKACPNCGNTKTAFNDNSDLYIYRCSCGKVYCDECSQGGSINLPRCPVSAYHEGMKKIGVVNTQKENIEKKNPDSLKSEKESGDKSDTISVEFFKAVNSGDIKKVERLLQLGADVNQKETMGDIPLHVTAKKGNFDLVKVLVTHGADVNKADPWGWTPLHHAAAGFNNRPSNEDDKLKVVEFLLENGAEIKSDGRGVTPLAVATQWGHNRIATVLKQAVVSNPQKSEEKKSEITDNPGEKKGQGCYIATACYQSYTHPDVLTLRIFRDKILLNSVFGRLFVSFYYAVSPPLALRIGKIQWLASGIRKLFLQPLARIIRKKHN